MTERMYQIGLEKLIKRQPNHALLGDLKKGFSKFNVIFLKSALDALPPPPPDGGDKVVTVLGEKRGFDGSNPLIAALMREQSDLFAERGGLSNSLHGFPFTAH